MLPLRILSGQEVRTLLPYPACIAAMRDAMAEVSRGNAALPLRHGMKLPNGNGVLGMMYGCLGEPEGFGIKLVSLFPGNRTEGLSTHMGLFILYEATHGKPVAILDGSVLTAIRTAAASAAATDVLARKDSKVLAILGTGEQAESHFYALRHVREFSRVHVWGRRFDQARHFAKEHGGDIPIRPIESIEAAVAEADVICTVTSSREPILTGAAVRPGTHVNLVGSSFPDTAEADTALVKTSRYFVDYLASAHAQAGEFLRAKAEGAITDAHIVGEIGRVILGEIAGRQSADEITIYKSLGVAAQDLAAADVVWRAAEKAGIGTVVEI